MELVTKSGRLAAALLLAALIARPCSISYPRKIWAKTPGSSSKLFAFEENGKVGFIDPAGKVVVPARITASIDDTGDFSGGLVRIRPQGYFDETGKPVIQGKYFWLDDFSDGLARAAVDDPEVRYGSLTKYLDPTGRVVATLKGLFTYDFSEGLAPYEA